MVETSAKIRGRILVVDDNRATRELLRRHLETENYEVMTAENGEEGLAKSRLFSPETILLDIDMPGMDGIETCRQLKKSDTTELIPVLFVTGSSDDETLAVRALEAGANDLISKDATPAILMARVSCQLAIFRSHETLRRMATTDELTGLATRRYMFEAMCVILKKASHERSPGIGCLLIDVDHFKEINDTRGHMAGDETLRRTGAVLRSVARESDLVARFGGDEFLVMLQDAKEEQVLTMAEEIRAMLATTCSISVSIGAAYFTSQEAMLLNRDRSIDEAMLHLIHRADAAMYRAKQRGRNCVEFEPSGAEEEPS